MPLYYLLNVNCDKTIILGGKAFLRVEFVTNQKPPFRVTTDYRPLRSAR